MGVKDNLKEDGDVIPVVEVILAFFVVVLPLLLAVEFIYLVFFVVAVVAAFIIAVDVDIEKDSEDVVVPFVAFVTASTVISQ